MNKRKKIKFKNGSVIESIETQSNTRGRRADFIYFIDEYGRYIKYDMKNDIAYDISSQYAE